MHRRMRRLARAAAAGAVALSVALEICLVNPSPYVARAVALASLLAGIACSDSPTRTSSGAPARLDVVAGNAQLGTVGAELPNPLVVKVVDDEGRPVRNQLINFRVTAGGGSVFAGSALTTGEGIAQERWTLGTTTVGEQRVEARAVDGSTGTALVFASFTATAAAGPVVALEVLAGREQSALAGSTLEIAPSVRARDQYGNPVAAATVTFAVQSGGGSIAAGTAATNESGVATAGLWTLGSESGTQSLNVTSGASAPVAITAVARSRTPAQLTVHAGDNQIGTAGAPVGVPPEVLVRNAHGDPLPGVTVTFAAAPGSGSVTGGSVTTGPLGRAAVGAWVLGSAVGEQTLNATAGDLTIVMNAVANADTPARIAVTSAPPASAEVGSTAAVSIRVVDRFDNPVSGITTAFEVTAGGGSVLVNAGPTSSEGTASAAWTLGTRSGPNALRIGAGAALSVTVETEALPGPPARILKLAGDGQTATVGTAVAMPPAIVVEDRFANPIPGAPITFSVGAGSGSVAAGGVTGGDGIATVTQWILGTVAGPNTLTAATSGLAAVTFSATGMAGPAVSLIKSAGDGQAAAPGTAVKVRPTIVARDAHDNPVPNVAVTFTPTSGHGSVTLSTAMTDESGTASVGSWILGTEGTPQELTASAAGVPPVIFSATSRARVPFRIAPHPSNPGSVTIGDRIRPAVVVLDELDDPVEGVAVTFSTSGHGNSVVGPAAVSDLNGVATVGEWRVGTCLLTATLTASASGVAPLDMTVPVSHDVAGSMSVQFEPSVNLNYSVDGGYLGTFSVKVYKACGPPLEPLPNVAVTLTVTSGVSFLSAQYPAQATGTTIVLRTNDYGVSGFASWHAGKTPGTTIVTMSAPGPGGTPVTSSFSRMIYHGNPARLVKIAGDDQVGPAGSTLPIAPVLRVEDAYGNPAPSYIRTGLGSGGLPGDPVTIRFTGLTAGTGTVDLVPNTNGIVTAPLWTLGPLVGFQSLLAHDVALLSRSATFTATATVPTPPD